MWQAVVGSAVRRNEAPALLKDRQPDVAIISALQEGALEDYRVLRDLRTVSSRTRGIILLHSRELRDEPFETLAKCIHAVHHGQIWADSESMRHVVEASSQAMPVRFRDGSGLSRLSKRWPLACLITGPFAAPRPLPKSKSPTKKPMLPSKISLTSWPPDKNPRDESSDLTG